MHHLTVSQGASLPPFFPLAIADSRHAEARMPDFRGASKFRKAANYWFDFGFSVIPVLPGTKQPAVKWGGWLKDLSRASINRYWLQHHDHEVGFIVGDCFVVLDADSAKAVSVLEQTEAHHGAEPLLIVKTRRGAHHYYRKDSDVRGRTACKIVGDAEDRIDIKTGRTMVILPPSTNKVLVKLGGDHACSLTLAPLPFIEAFVPGFAPVEPPSAQSNAHDAQPVTSTTLKLTGVCLGLLDPDLAYPDWFRVAAVIFNVTHDDPAGYAQFDDWSSLGEKYKGPRDTGTLWRSLKSDHSQAVGMGTLIRLVNLAGYTREDVMSALEPFDKLDGGGV